MVIIVVIFCHICIDPLVVLYAFLDVLYIQRIMISTVLTSTVPSEINYKIIKKVSTFEVCIFYLYGMPNVTAILRPVCFSPEKISQEIDPST